FAGSLGGFNAAIFFFDMPAPACGVSDKLYAWAESLMFNTSATEAAASNLSNDRQTDQQALENSSATRTAFAYSYDAAKIYSFGGGGHSQRRWQDPIA